MLGLQQQQHHYAATTSSGGSGAADNLEAAGRFVEKMLHSDAQFPQLAEKLRISGQRDGPPSLSGLQESDYPLVDLTVNGGATVAPPGGPLGATSAGLYQKSSLRKVPLPAELVEHFGQMQANCMIGLFPQVDRAWLTIDSDIYVWRYADCQDLAYFDGLSDTILSVGLLTPKMGVFLPQIRHLLCLTTTAEMVLLGVTFGSGEEEMQLLPEPLFTLSTDSTHMLCIKGTNTGRIFLGGKDGCLYEFTYKAEEGWFGKKAYKINHSTSTFSFLIPAFINSAIAEEDPIVQLEMDDSRNVLYSRSEKGTIQVFDLGLDGLQLIKVVSVSQQAIAKEAARFASNIDRSNFSPIVGISALCCAESLQISLVAVTSSGVRFYFSTTGTNPSERPSFLMLRHIRLPPGFSASPSAGRPAKVHMSYYNNGTLLLASAQNESSDKLWLLSGDCFPFQSVLMEGQSTLTIDGRVWALEEIPHSGRLHRLYMESFAGLEPPLASLQHSQPARRFVLISAQGTHIVSKLRPCDQLRQMLIDHGGPDEGAVREFFALNGETQACATCLVLACSQSVQDAQVAEWATRAFLLYGGEPRSSAASAMNLMHFSGVVGTGDLRGSMHQDPFHPNIASTPAMAPTATTTTTSSPIYHHSLLATPPGSPTNPLSPFQQQLQSPMFGSAGGAAPNMVCAEVMFSGKHNGLYLYFSRLIRPIYLKPLVVPTITTSTPQSNEVPLLTSSVSSEEVDWVIFQLRDLKAFMERNGQFAVSSSSASSAATNKFHHHHHHADQQQHHQFQMQQQDAVLRERQSLLFLQQLIQHSIQVLGLWKVVCEHQPHLIFSGNHLRPDELGLVRGMYFRDLIISAVGREMCGRLVQAVVAVYLEDNARTDAISNRLREACPSLYNSDDAISSKAHEMIIRVRAEASKGSNGGRERDRIVKEAIALCKEVAGKLNLEILASHLVAVHAYMGVLEICLASAARRDPQGLALHFYRNGEPSDDHQGLNTFLARSACYKCVTSMLKRLFEAANLHYHHQQQQQQQHLQIGQTQTTSTASTSSAIIQQLTPQEAGAQAEEVLDAAIKSDDELFHVEIYQWLLSEKMYDRLLSIRSAYLEDFLTRASSSSSVQSHHPALSSASSSHHHQQQLVVYDLLWKYYEKTRNYLSAAKILAKLSDRHGTEITLKQRIEYLSRAIVCFKSGEAADPNSRSATVAGQVGGSSSELLHDLEEKMEVARVQLQVLEAVGNLKQQLRQRPRTPRKATDEAVDAAISRLNSDLMDISQLYADFAEPFELWECQLSILHCAGHADNMLIGSVWDHIIDEEVSRTAEMASIYDRVTVMSNKVKALAKLYSSSQKYFPMEHIIRRLEHFSVQVQAPRTWVFSSLVEAGVPLPKVFEVYNKLCSSNDPIWLTSGCPNHLLRVLAKILDSFADSPSQVSFHERRQFTVHCLDVVGNCLGTLYMKHDSNDLVREYRSIQVKLERI